MAVVNSTKPSAQSFLNHRTKKAIDSIHSNWIFWLASSQVNES